jgi:hypothetical protein
MKHIITIVKEAQTERLCFEFSSSASSAENLGGDMDVDTQD